MHVSPRAPLGRSRTTVHVALLSALVSGVVACGGSSSGGGQSGITGQENPKLELVNGVLQPTGGTFFVDPNESGRAPRPHLAEVLYGRLVDVHDVDAGGDVNPEPVFQDFVIGPDILTGTSSNGVNRLLERNPVTQEERLVIFDEKGIDGSDAPAGPDPFDVALREAGVLPEVAAKDDDGTSAPPFTVVPRNACVVLRMDDCFDDDAEAATNLVNTVRILTGYSPNVPFLTRIVFDPNYGAVLGDGFHSTRILVDMTLSEAESLTLPVTLDFNAVGLPASIATTNSPNVSLRIPTRVDFGSGQFQILRNTGGAALSFDENAPNDPFSPTDDIVRAIRSGNPSNPQQSNGFLPDLDSPRLIGDWPVDLSNAINTDAGAGFEFTVDLSFPTVCQDSPELGDVLTIGGALLEVTDDSGSLSQLGVRSLTQVADADSLEGSAHFLSAFDPNLAVDEGCWLSFVPLPGIYPSTDVSTAAQLRLRFSEPMDPDSLSPLENLLLVQGPGGGTSSASTNNLVLGDVAVGADLDEFALSPRLAMPHEEGSSEMLHLELSGARDLAGNPLRFNSNPLFFNFTLDPLAASESNGSVVLRFNDDDEVLSDSKDDLRGQFFYDFARGVIMPRQVAVSGWPVDRNNPVPALMAAVPTGAFTPLSPLGAKVQMVWRYCDMGWNVLDETKYNLDVTGLNWSPIGGQVVADFFEQFEIRLGHSRFFPDDFLNQGPAPLPLPRYPVSGLLGSPNFFEDNYLVKEVTSGQPAIGQPQVVHNRALGYTVNPATLFLSPSGTQMIPYPLNRSTGVDVTYTWRDTAILVKGGGGDSTQPGIPPHIENQATGVTMGSVAPRGQVPSFGLPLLIEVRCFPSDRGVGLNRFDVSMPPTNPGQPTSHNPNFRAYSSGGIDSAGRRQEVNPDTALVPAGGYDPNSVPPGQRTANDADNVFYLGQLDTVVRISRVHTIWLDVGLNVSPSWQTPVLDPPGTRQPAGVSISLDFRGAAGFSGGTEGDEFDATKLDVYGDLGSRSPQFGSGGQGWSSNIAVGNGQRFLQVRLTFTNNLQTGLNAELSALALPFED